MRAGTSGLVRMGARSLTLEKPGGLRPCIAQLGGRAIQVSRVATGRRSEGAPDASCPELLVEGLGVDVLLEDPQAQTTWAVPDDGPGRLAQPAPSSPLPLPLVPDRQVR